MSKYLFSITVKANSKEEAIGRFVREDIKPFDMDIDEEVEDNRISAEHLGFEITGDKEVIRDIIKSIREVYDATGNDMPKSLGTVVYEFEHKLAMLT